ncbi:MAG TPA: hypothetical protein VHB25_01725 [Gemmatimonadaceae bacterium]|nr:hypothetical protein [Gemmatimonadaceae bacterium]
MPSRQLVRAFLALWLVTGAVLFIASVSTAYEGWVSAHGVNPHLVLLGGIEALAAALFLIPRTMRVGAIGLLATIGIALAVHAALGQFRGDLILYASAVAFIRVHGGLTPEQWGLALRGG